MKKNKDENKDNIKIVSDKIKKPLKSVKNALKTQDETINTTIQFNLLEVIIK